MNNIRKSTARRLAGDSHLAMLPLGSVNCASNPRERGHARTQGLCRGSTGRRVMDRPRYHDEVITPSVRVEAVKICMMVRQTLTGGSVQTERMPIG